MIPYFANEQVQDNFIKEITKWIGVPYRHTGENKAGTDCAKFIALIYVEMGILEKLEPGIIYSRDWFLHGDCQLIVNSFSSHGKKYLRPGLTMELFEYANQQLIFPGDILFFSTCNRNICNHAGLYLGHGKFIHCLEKKGVYIAEFSEHWRPKAKKLFRIFCDGN